MQRNYRRTQHVQSRPEEDEVMLEAEAQKQLEELLEDEELELSQEGFQ